MLLTEWPYGEYEMMVDNTALAELPVGHGSADVITR